MKLSEKIKLAQETGLKWDDLIDRVVRLEDEAVRYAYEAGKLRGILRKGENLASVKGIYKHECSHCHRFTPITAENMIDALEMLREAP